MSLFVSFWAFYLGLIIILCDFEFHTLSQWQDPQQHAWKQFSNVRWHLLQSWEDQGGSQMSKQNRRIATNNSSFPPSSLEAGGRQLSTVSPGSRKLYFADAGRQRRHKYDEGGLHKRAKPPVVALSICSKHKKDFWPSGWLADLFIMKCQLPVQAHAQCHMCSNMPAGSSVLWQDYI